MKYIKYTLSNYYIQYQMLKEYKEEMLILTEYFLFLIFNRKLNGFVKF